MGAEEIITYCVAGATPIAMGVSQWLRKSHAPRKFDPVTAFEHIARDEAKRATDLERRLVMGPTPDERIEMARKEFVADEIDLEEYERRVSHALRIEYGLNHPPS